MRRERFATSPSKVKGKAKYHLPYESVGTTTQDGEMTMANKIKLTAHVSTRLNGGKAIAFKTLGGAYNAQQALWEFKRDPQRWEAQPGTTPEGLALYAKAA